MGQPTPELAQLRRAMLARGAAWAIDAALSLSLAGALLKALGFETHLGTWLTWLDAMRHFQHQLLHEPTFFLRYLASCAVYDLMGVLGLPDAAGWLLLGRVGTWVIYRTLTEATGQSVGKWVLGLEVLGPEGDPGVARALVRSVTCVPDAALLLWRGRACFDPRLGLEHTQTEGRRGGLAAGAWIVLGLLGGAWAAHSSPEARARQLRTEMRLLLAYGDTDCCASRPAPWAEEGMVDHCDGMMQALAELARQGVVTAQTTLGTCPPRSPWRQVATNGFRPEGR